jgi:ABC-2 type transport system permease protein
MRETWFIARTEIAHQLRRRETLLWIFVMPILFFYFIGTVTGGFGSTGSGERREPLALRAPANGGFLVDELVRRLEAQNFRVVRPPDENTFDRYDRRLTVPAPADGKTFTDAVLAGQRQTLVYRTRTEGPGTNFERIRLARAIYALVADLAAAGEDGTPGPAAVRAVADAPRPLRLEITSAGHRVVPPSGFSQTIPGTVVMFTMLVLLTGGAIRLVVEREQGLLRRLASTPISRASVVAGKWAGKLLLGLAQIGFGLAAGTWLFSMDWGGALPMVMIVLAAWAAFNASLALLLGNLARSVAQMSGVGVLTTMVLAALGGCWWPIEITPRWTQQLALALPTGWTMHALHQLINFGAGPSAAVLPTAALVAGALALGVAGVRTFRYQ